MERSTLKDVLEIFGSVSGAIELSGCTGSFLTEYDVRRTKLAKTIAREANVTMKEALDLPLDLILQQKGEREFASFKNWLADQSTLFEDMRTPGSD